MCIRDRKQPAQQEIQPEIPTQTGDVNLQEDKHENSKTTEGPILDKMMEMFLQLSKQMEENSKKMEKDNQSTKEELSKKMDSTNEESSKKMEGINKNIESKMEENGKKLEDLKEEFIITKEELSLSLIHI